MKKRAAKGSTWFAVGALMTQLTLGSAQANLLLGLDDIEQEAQTVVFNKRVYETEIRKRFEDGSSAPKGYSTVLMHEGNLVSEVSGNSARDDTQNTQIDMDMHVYANVGSTAKFVTGIALLHAFETPDPQANPNNLSVEELLDQPIYNYIPQVWKDVSHPTIGWIRFGDLLKHKSGFISAPTDQLLERLNTGVDVGSPSDCGIGSPTYVGYCHGIRNYTNINFTLLGYLIAAYKYPQVVANLDAAYLSKGKNIAFASVVLDTLGVLYEDFMQNTLFSATTPNIDGSCDPVNELPEDLYALMYTSQSDPLSGVVYSEKATLEDWGYAYPHCRGQGGWYYPAYDLGALVANLQKTNNVISPSLYNSLYNPFGTFSQRNDRMVWSSEIGSAGLAAKFGWAMLPFAGGDQPVPVGQGRRTVYAHATIVRLPAGYHAVAIINSDEMSSIALSVALRDAFDAAITVN